MIGKTITHYRLFESLGKGGMGEVYRAEDSKLQRQVAVKVLPAEMASDRERLARFEREAHLLAALNHPNVATIYGLETEEANPFLVMELVEGDTLQERIAKGRLGGDEIRDVFSQIANGLEAAHEKGVVHRDLKPANIKITAKGVVKILDFGLAKVFESPQPDLSRSPTLTTGTTRAGVILGTAAYMSPEQAKGKPVDRSGDVWAFGCILYEALTGRKAFDGDSITEILAAVLRAEPDPDLLPDRLPPSLRRLLRLCLKKDPSERIRDIRDVRIQFLSSLQDSEPEMESPPEEAVPEPTHRRAVFWGATGLLLGLLAGLLIWVFGSDSGSAPRAVQRFQVSADRLVLAGISSSVAVSPDGSRIVYVGGEQGQLYQRPLNRVESTALPSTEGAIGPFFSPDSQWIGFWADDRLKKMPVSGGSPRTICQTESVVFGASWGKDENIYFSSSGQQNSPSLWRVSAAGGKPESLLAPADEEGQKRVLIWPQVLPGGRAIIFTNLPFEPVPEEGRVEMLRLDQQDARPETLVEGAVYGRYAHTGHIVAAWQGGLVSIPFDVEELQAARSQSPVLDDLWLTDAFVPHFDFSQDGTLVYVAGSSRAGRNSLLWADREDGRSPVTSDLKGFLNPRISPDGRQLAVAVAEDDRRNIWIYDLERGTALKPITFEGINALPAWGPEGNRLAFSSSRGGPQRSLFIQPTDGSGSADQLYEADYLVQAADWTRDGKEIILQEFNQSGDSDIRILSLEGGGETRDYLVTPFVESSPRLSPDGHWLAYQSNQSGEDEVYVRPYPGPGQETRVSRGGGASPLWSRDANEIFYRSRNRLMAVGLKTGLRLEVSEPQTVLRNLRPEETVADLSPDGRFLLLKQEEQNRDIRLMAVLNWFQELDRPSSR